MRHTLVFLIIVLCSAACGSDKILCPENRALKLRESAVNPEKLKKDTPESTLHSTLTNKSNRHRYKYVDIKIETARTLESVEEWDCPRPGSRKNKRAAKDYLRKQEKKVRYILTDSTQTVSLQ